eukprot:GHVT01062314.1.p1 GENE.GHVT01062314.1~~GHVT01062314.1.p1  ORF type:complete len:153 (+),score=41.25 GHVT01062314.1:182-640(+)
MVSVALSREFSRTYRYFYNRKEAKTHGEGGELVGGPPAAGSRVLIVDDVLTAGTAAGEVVQLLLKHKLRPVGLAIALDRQEVVAPPPQQPEHRRPGDGGDSALSAFCSRHALRPISVVNLNDLLVFAANSGDVSIERAAVDIQKYRDMWGAQ